MENFYSKTNKISIFLIVLLTLNIVLFLNPKFVSKINLKTNLMLYHNNKKLNDEFQELNRKMDVIESGLNSLNDYDNYLNAQMLGLDIDKIGIDLISDVNLLDFTDNMKINMKIEQMSETIHSQRIKTIRLAELAKVNENAINMYPNGSPLDTVVVSSKFGWRVHPILKKLLLHKGIDVAASSGSNIYATMTGIVSKIERSNTGYGNHIILTNSLGFETRYAHLNRKIYVNVGQYVGKGQLIAQSGNTGLSTAPHLHYEIRKNGRVENPLDYIFMYNIINTTLVKNYENKNKNSTRRSL